MMKITAISIATGIGIIAILMNIVLYYFISRPSYSAPQTWVTKRCDIYYGRNHCRLPFNVVITNTDEIAGRPILIEGYVAKDGGTLAIYPDQYSAERVIQQSALAIKPTTDGEINRSLEYALNRSVLITGKIERVASRFNSYWAIIDLDRPINPGSWRTENKAEPDNTERSVFGR